MYQLHLKFKSFKPLKILKLKKLRNKLNLKKLLSISNSISPIKKKKLFVVLRSPHVNKKSREHFSFETFATNYYVQSKNLRTLLTYLIFAKKFIQTDGIGLETSIKTIIKDK